MSAVRLGEKNMATTNAASAIPQDTAKPIWDRMVFPARVVAAYLLLTVLLPRYVSWWRQAVRRRSVTEAERGPARPCAARIL